MNTSLYNQSAVDALVAGSLIAKGADFSIPYGTSQAPDNRNPGFVDEYAGGQISSYISPWFYEVLKGEAAHILNGNADPRLPYYICTQLGATEDPENPTEYQNDRFVSIYFGSQGVYRDGAGRNTFAMIGLYPVGGAFDSPDLNKASGLGVDAGTGAAPLRLLTHADVLFLQAELIAKGKISGDLKATLESAMLAAFAQVDAVATVAKKAGATVPALTGSDAVTAYITKALAEFDAANDDGNDSKMDFQVWFCYRCLHRLSQNRVPRYV